MLALILWVTLGWRAGLVGVLAEVAIGSAIVGGGGRRLRLSPLSLLRRALAGLRAPAAQHV